MFCWSFKCWQKSFQVFPVNKARGFTCYVFYFSFPLRGVQQTVSRNTSVWSSAELPTKFLSESILHYGLRRAVMCSHLPFLNTMTTLWSFSTILYGGETGCMCMSGSPCPEDGGSKFHMMHLQDWRERKYRMHIWNCYTNERIKRAKSTEHTHKTEGQAFFSLKSKLKNTY